MNGLKVKTIIILQVIMTVMAFQCMAKEKVSFRHKTVNPSAFKLDCYKIQGPQDAFASYTCFDEAGDSEKFDPGIEWEEVTVEPLCYRHSIRDNIRACIRIQGKQNKTEYYGCIDAKGCLIPFTPDQNIWEKLEADNPECTPHIIEMDVPRGTIHLKNDEPDGSNCDKQGKGHKNRNKSD